jgi:NAD(P)-dependent dehydrogenase (short-subunit alcohol dehydrogenase family)
MKFVFADLKNGHALVTGSTQGIGKAICRELLKQGVKVFGIALDEDPKRNKDAYFAIRSDLSKLESLQAALDQLRTQTVHLDYLVNVAGIDPKYSISESDENRWKKVIDTNLRAYYFLIRETLDLLRAGKGKSIVNVSSINYRLGVPKRSLYSISKSGILGITTGLARELGSEEIRINSVSPGWVFTERQIREYFSKPEDRQKNLETVKLRQAVNHQITPQDIANHVLFYLSRASQASTGHNCVVDAGWLLE